MDDDSRIDLAQGVPVGDIPAQGGIAGRVGQEDVVLLRGAGALYAVGAHCTHYGGDLALGLVVGDTVRCPLHHACFSLRTGEALSAPALDALGCWRVEEVDATAYVREKIVPAASEAQPPAAPASILIVGAGAAGLAAAEMLRRKGYAGPLTMVSADVDPPCDRPNLSKDYLAGTASPEWMPLRPAEFYQEHRIDLLLDSKATAIDVSARRVRLEGGRELDYGALLLATGADPVRLDVPGAAPGQIQSLRSFSDSRAILAKAASARCAVIVGASFIGLEVAASLRAHGIEVHVVGLEDIPMERVLGAEVGRFVQALHESHGVVFHLGATLERVEGRIAVLSDGTRHEADLIVMGVGVRPAIALAEQAGLATDRGVLVDEYLQTSAGQVFAAGDIARWPDPHSGERIRVEHWVVAERQGQVAALNMLGGRQAFDAVPFFWSQHYDLAIHYVGHAQEWDTIAIDGSLQAHDCSVSYLRKGRLLALATIGRELKSLETERAMEVAR